MERLNALRLMRLMAGRSQLEVAYETGISQALLSQFERGFLKPKAEQLKALLKIYHFSQENLRQIEGALEPLEKIIEHNQAPRR